MIERCGRCRFWFTGACRRFPPTPVAMHFPPLNDQVNIEIQSFFPSVGPDFWCGEFKHDPTKEQEHEVGDRPGRPDNQPPH